MTGMWQATPETSTAATPVVCNRMPPEDTDLRGCDARDVRMLVREGAYNGPTAGLGRGKLQVGIAILPSCHASDFIAFCRANPKPLPLVGVGRIGSPLIPDLGAVDVRTDLPRYDVLKFGTLAEVRTDITDLWRNDLIALAFGSALTADQALIKRGVRLRHVAQSRPLPLFRSRITTAPVGAFGGEMVVSMRPVRRRDLDALRVITARFPHAHGAPLHVGDPEVIGIQDLDEPEWGLPIAVESDEVPVFWASGQTAGMALQRAKLPFFVMQSPGHMLITDIGDQAGIGGFEVF